MINLCKVLNSSSSVPVHAHWEPIADATFNMHNDSPQLAEMFDLSPCYPVKEYGAEDFKVFFPPSTVAVGDVWALDPHRIVPFLYQFHPGARADLGNGAEGAYACLRACSSDYAEIIFRIHAEFTLGSDAHQEWQRENFELFHADTELPLKEGTDAALDGAWNVSPGSIGHIFHNFSRGRHFKLVATGADAQKANAFLARVSVVPHS